MEGARLLEWLFNIFCRLMSQTESNAADETLDVRRILQPSTKCHLQPRSRFLSCAQDRTARSMLQDCSIFRVSHKQTPEHVATRQIGSHVEFARVSWRG